MKTLILLASLCLGTVVEVSAQFITFNSGFDNSGNIPDGNVNPWGDTFGYGDPGLNVTFTDGAPNNIHFYQTRQP